MLSCTPSIDREEAGVSIGRTRLVHSCSLYRWSEARTRRSYILWRNNPYFNCDLFSGCRTYLPWLCTDVSSVAFKWYPTVFWSDIRSSNVSSTKEISPVSFYSSRKVKLRCADNGRDIFLRTVLILSWWSQMVRWRKRTKLLQKVMSPRLLGEIVIDFLVVICLSDDEEDGNSELTTPIKQQTVNLANGLTKPETSPPSDWLVHRKDVVRVPDLSIKRSDLIKKPIEIGCSVICFGIAEFHVESETIQMKETDFEFKLKSKAALSPVLPPNFIDCRWLGGQSEHTARLFRYTDVLFFLSIEAACGIHPGAPRIRRSLR